MNIPNWYSLLLLAAAAFRTWTLLAQDTIINSPRERGIFLIRKRWGNGAAEKARELIECPWCLGAWISLAWWGAWIAWPHGTLVAAVPLAISALVGLAGSR